MMTRTAGGKALGWERGFLGRWALAAQGFVLTLIAGGLACGPLEEVQQPFDLTGRSLAEAAQAEGRVVFYANLPRHITRRLTETFQRRYPGIKVEYTQTRAALSLEKIRTEARMGRQLVDVINGGANNFVEVLKLDGLLQPFTPSNTSFLKEELIDPDGYLWPTYVNLYGILINTDLVPPSREPKSWADLLDPAWVGQILIDDPSTTIGGGFTWFVTVASRMTDLGRGFLKRLALQKPTFTRQYLEAEKAVARGEYAIYLPALEASVERLKGVPLKWIAPADGVIVLPIASALLKNAPHPHAGKLWIDFLLTEDAQRIFLNQGLPARSGVPLPRPSLSIEDKKLYFVKGEEYRRGREFVTLVKEIFP